MCILSSTFPGPRARAGLALLAAVSGLTLSGCVGPKRSEQATGSEFASGAEPVAREPLVSVATAPGTSVAEITPGARPAKWAEPIALPGLPNLHRVTPVLYRSAQPTPAGWASLEQLGVRTVLSLRAFHVDEVPRASKLRPHRISFKSWHPEEEDVVRFLTFVRDPGNQPVLVHCQHGADRTGMMVATLRMALEGWSRKDAIREMVEGGYGFHSIWQNMIDYVERVDVERLRRLAGIEPASVAR